MAFFGKDSLGEPHVDHQHQDTDVSGQHVSLWLGIMELVLTSRT